MLYDIFMSHSHAEQIISHEKDTTIFLNIKNISLSVGEHLY